eukprot:9330314-Lingulodinium_polyedra.AAC.1
MPNLQMPRRRGAPQVQTSVNTRAHADLPTPGDTRNWRMGQGNIMQSLHLQAAAPRPRTAGYAGSAGGGFTALALVIRHNASA